MNFAIEAANVTKIYRRFANRRQFSTLKSALLKGTVLRDLNPAETFAAVSDVSFQVRKGTTYGIIGRNGSGKSTMLKLIAGITKPTTGNVTVDGRISALIELGAGFHPEISGRENVYINGIMLGLTKRQVAQRFDEIVEFADLRDFIDAPVKTYSSGMYMRLGFAVAINVDPDVLLVDEVLAVGDEAFTHKCLDKFSEFRRRGKTILLVTHSLNLVERFCDDVLWLDAGKVRGGGDPRRIVSAYLSDVAETEEEQLSVDDAKAREAVLQAPAASAPATAADSAPVASDPAAAGEAPSDMFKASQGRWGSRELEITDVAIVDEQGQPRHIFQSGDPIGVRFTVRSSRPVKDFVFGVGLFNVDGVCCYGTNTYLEELESDGLSGDGSVTLRIGRIDLVEGTYKVDLAAHRADGSPYDYHRLLYSFRVKSRIKDVGIYRPPHEWVFSDNIRFKPLEKLPGASLDVPSAEET